MAKTLEFTSRGQHDPIPFTLDGDEYLFTPKKVARTVLPMMDPEAAGGKQGDYRTRMSQASWEWFKGGLPPEQYKRIIDKLKDEDDPLDYPDVTDVTNRLITEVSGRPTRRR